VSRDRASAANRFEESILAKCAAARRESPNLARRLHDSTARQALHFAGEYMIFRVRITRLNSNTVYYYKVESTGATGASDGVSRAVKTFKTQ
jgi:hypothetical protein